MPYYLCRIAGEDGRVAVRSMLAPSAEECRKAFEATGVLVLSARRDWNRLEAQGFRLGKKVKDRDIILFNQELVALIKAGYPILKSLEAISGRIKNIYLKEILHKVAEGVKRGKALSEAFQRQGARLPEGAAQGELPALRRQAPHRRGEGHGLLVLPALPAGAAPGVRRLDAHRPLNG